jgi:hypothetical protein
MDQGQGDQVLTSEPIIRSMAPVLAAMWAKKGERKRKREGM